MILSRPQKTHSAAFDLCLRDRSVSAEALTALEDRIANEPDNLELRLLLLGRALRARGRPHESVLWLIEHHPELDLRHYWTAGHRLAAPAKELWRAALERDHDILLYSNAAWSLADGDVAFAESVYALAERRVEPSDLDYWYRRASFFQTLLESGKAKDLSQRQRFASAVVVSLANALLRETDPSAKLVLTFPLRFAAPATGDPRIVHLTRLADAEATRAHHAGCETPLGISRAHTFSGLIALVIGDQARAEEELALSKRAGRFSSAHDGLLETELRGAHRHCCRPSEPTGACGE